MAAGYEEQAETVEKEVEKKRQWKRKCEKPLESLTGTRVSSVL